MSDSPWVALRQAQEAVNNHRPEDAHRLIEPLIAEGYRKAVRLARAVVTAYVARAMKSLDQHNADAAWRDLLDAESLNTGEAAVASLRQSLSRLGLVKAQAALEAGDPLRTVAVVGRLRDRGVRHPDLAQYEAVAQDWGLAAELADRGEFLRAAALLDKLEPKLPCPPTGFAAFRADVEDRHARFRAAVGKLYDAAEAKQWRDALDAAEEVLTVAPDHREAKAIRGKAWLAAFPNDNASPDDSGRVEIEHVRRDSPTLPYKISNLHPSLSQSQSPPSPAPAALPKRFLLWVDGVGGYLVCLSNRVTFGQATGDGPVDVPLFADVSRLHAELTRDGEGYVFESAKGVLVNGKGSTRSVLAAGDRVTLGSTCQFLFHRPVSVSGTARLELTSGHRLPVAVDGVLLMANEVMLGPGPNVHIVLPDLQAPVIIYRSKDGLGVRVPGSPFRIDDRPCNDRAVLPLPAVVTADAFTFAVEPVTGRL
ncbi:MAG: FHA domain-containing protein [Planctomycetes bacterium]|nr:FHA domain-containing protein [Planctomycetota bacterium]